MKQWFPEGGEFEPVNKMNHLLAPVEETLERDVPAAPRLPQVFITGPPRSASTISYQLIAHHGGFGYPSNFFARFWATPLVGATIERALGVRTAAAAASYKNEFGRTTQWHEPHEFGYWFNRWFDRGQGSNVVPVGQRDDIDRDAMRHAMAALESALGGPLVFGNNSWCTYHTDFLHEVFPDSVFAVCERDPLYVAQSILSARIRVTGDKENWWSMRPAETPELLERPWWEQIAGQVYYTMKAQEEGLAKVPEDRIVRFPYQAMCADPRAHVDRVIDAVNQKGAAVAKGGMVPDRLEPTDVQRVSDEDFERLKEGVRMFFGEDAATGS